MIRIIYSPAGVIIGDKMGASHVDLNALKNPRLLIETPIEGQPGMVHIHIGELRGKPKGIEIGKNFLNYDVNDEHIISAYNQAVTGIVLPGNSVQ